VLCNAILKSIWSTGCIAADGNVGKDLEELEIHSEHKKIENIWKNCAIGVLLRPERQQKVGKGRVLRGLKSFWKILKIEFFSCPAAYDFWK
jgi:hypothetical protein